MWELTKSTFFWVFVLVFSLLISIQNPRGDSDKYGTQCSEMRLNQGLKYDFYRFSCPDAEAIIKSTVKELYENHSNVAPALLRLAFHDCFVEGCDGSVLLDSVDGFRPEKEAFPNAGSLRGYEYIDIIKARLEVACPSIVSCADIVVLSARDAVVMAGGPFIPLSTGRRDGTRSLATIAEADLPSPLDDLNTTLATFMAKGFDQTDIVSLLGAHTIGNAHCRFFVSRLYNFSGDGKPDRTMNRTFARHLKSVCHRNATTPDPAVPMDEGSSFAFDGHYYQNVRLGKGVLFVDQTLMGSNATRNCVETYASNDGEFYRDFARAMVKLCNLNTLTGSQGQVRKKCSEVVRIDNESNSHRPHTGHPVASSSSSSSRFP